MQRSTLDKLISTSAIIVALVLLMAAIGLFFAHTFIHGQVSDQLSSEKITFPAKDSAAFTSLPTKDQTAISSYAGQQVVNGAQAAVFANDYIAVHLDKIGGGQTYSELSTASNADPTNTALVSKVSTVFKGETLRGMLLNAYAFDTMATVALIAAFSTLAAGVILAILALLGFSHARQIKRK